MHNEYDKKSKDDNIAKHSLRSTSFYLSTLFKPTFPAHFSKQHFPGHFTNNILLPGISPTPKNMFCKCVTIYKVGGVEVLSKIWSPSKCNDDKCVKNKPPHENHAVITFVFVSQSQFENCFVMLLQLLLNRSNVQTCFQNIHFKPIMCCCSGLFKKDLNNKPFWLMSLAHYSDPKINLDSDNTVEIWITDYSEGSNSEHSKTELVWIPNI